MYPNESCSETYVGEKDRGTHARIIDHIERDKISHLIKHNPESQHTQHKLKDDFKILEDGNYKSCIKRKVSETLYIKRLKNH